ncbi:toxin-antitoxin system, toxin component [Streptomyces sp. XY431]|nr:toxin-antitoxin system, toxin component [Streptomyces sp. XY431]
MATGSPPGRTREGIAMNAEPQWFTSSYSSNGGDCIEVARNLVSRADVVPVRDSKDTKGPALTFPAEAWRSFLSAVRAGEFGAV